MTDKTSARDTAAPVRARSSTNLSAFAFEVTLWCLLWLISMFSWALVFADAMVARERRAASAAYVAPVSVAPHVP